MSRVAGGVGFVHLRVHSAYSLLEGALPIKRLAELAAADKMPALGIADTGNLFGALEFAEKMAEKGIQPIIGCQVALDFGDLDDEGRPGAPRERQMSDIVLIAASEAGYWNLVRLVSDSFMRTDPEVRPHVAIADLATRADGLIALTGGPAGTDRPGDCGRAGAARSIPARCVGGDIWRPPLRRSSAPRNGNRRSRAPAANRVGLCPWTAAGRHQRAVLSRRARTTRPTTR